MAQIGEENVTESEVCGVQRRGINSLEAAAGLCEAQEGRINSLEKALGLCEAQSKVGSIRYIAEHGLGAYLRCSGLGDCCGQNSLPRDTGKAIKQFGSRRWVLNW